MLMGPRGRRSCSVSRRTAWRPKASLGTLTVVKPGEANSAKSMLSMLTTAMSSGTAPTVLPERLEHSKGDLVGARDDAGEVCLFINKACLRVARSRVVGSANKLVVLLNVQ